MAGARVRVRVRGKVRARVRIRVRVRVRVGARVKVRVGGGDTRHECEVCRGGTHGGYACGGVYGRGNAWEVCVGGMHWRHGRSTKAPLSPSPTTEPPRVRCGWVGAIPVTSGPYAWKCAWEVCMTDAHPSRPLLRAPLTKPPRRSPPATCRAWGEGVSVS